MSIATITFPKPPKLSDINIPMTFALVSIAALIVTLFIA